MVNTDLLLGTNDMVLSLGGRVLTAKDCMVINFSIDMNRDDYERVASFGGYVEKIKPQELVDITINMKCTADSLNYLFDERETVKGKKVEDCSIRELLFAIRKKSRGKKK